MISSLRRSEILQQAADVLMEHGNGLPVDPMAIAKAVGIEVQPFRSERKGISGFLMMAAGKFGIGYSESIRNKGFENFTVGHELGHYFLSGHVEALLSEGVHYSQSGFISTNTFEQEADCFSAELLMPKGAFLDQLRKAGEGFEAIEKLAKGFQTSLVATAIRFAQLGEEPIAVIMSCGNKIEFCVLSEAIKEQNMKWLVRGDFVPEDSATFRFNRDTEGVRGARRAKCTSTLDMWFEGARSLEMKEDVVGLGHYGRTLTVLFTEEALGEDEDDDQDEGEEMPSQRWMRRDRDRC